MAASYTILDSPFGDVLVAWSGRGLERVIIGDDPGAHADPTWRRVPRLDCPATRQLRAYFEGTRREFDLPLVLEGTPFQTRVWRALTRIRYGETASYAEIGRWIGSPGAPRAVGAACGSNPLPIVVPCHRVIGSTGRLVGFGGGLAMKRAMLEFEREHSTPVQGRLALGHASPRAPGRRSHP
jgi:methylated-DNA-[protein]-cysteine S-methyltransferase